MLEAEGSGVLDLERGKLADIRKAFWQTDTAVAKKSWGYVEDADYKTADSLVDDLVDIVSKNGCMLLNVGPKTDGTFDQESLDLLSEIGS